MDATEKTGDVNVKTIAIFQKNRRAAPRMGLEGDWNGIGMGSEGVRDGPGTVLVVVRGMGEGKKNFCYRGG